MAKELAVGAAGVRGGGAEWEWGGWDGACSPRAARRALCARLMEVQRYTAGKLGEERFAQLRRDAAVHLREDQLPGAPGSASPASDLRPAGARAAGRPGRGGAPPEKRMWWCTAPPEPLLLHPPDGGGSSGGGGRGDAGCGSRSRGREGHGSHEGWGPLLPSAVGDSLGSPALSGSAGAITGSPFEDFDVGDGASDERGGQGMASLGRLELSPLGDLLADDSLLSPSALDAPAAGMGIAASAAAAVAGADEADLEPLLRPAGGSFWRDPRFRFYGDPPAPLPLLPPWGGEEEAEEEADDGEDDEDNEEATTGGDTILLGRPVRVGPCDPASGYFDADTASLNFLPVDLDDAEAAEVAAALKPPNGTFFTKADAALFALGPAGDKDDDDDRNSPCFGPASSSDTHTDPRS